MMFNVVIIKMSVFFSWICEVPYDGLRGFCQVSNLE